MAAIDVERMDPGAFRVRVTEPSGSTEHRVTLKEASLSSFDVTVIARSFPEFESTIRR